MPNNPYYKNQALQARAATLDAYTASALEEDLDVGSLGATPWHSKLSMPVYRGDGELDAVYVGRQTRHRQKIVLVSFLVYTAVMVALEVPYVLYVFGSGASREPSTASISAEDFR